MKKLWLLVLTFIVYGCAEEELPVVTNELTVEEVKQTVITKSTGFAQGRTDALLLDFDNPEFGNESIFFSLEGADNLYLSTQGTAKNIQAKNGGFAWAYKEEGEIKVELILPYSTTNEAALTGFYLATDYMTGEHKRLYLFEGGKYIDTYDVDSEKTVKTADGGRTSLEADCYLITGRYYTVVTAGSSIYINYDDISEEVICYYTGDPATSLYDYAAPVKEIESGGVGGGYVQPICSSPYVSDGEGGCMTEEEYEIQLKILDFQKAMDCEKMTNLHGQTRKNQWDFYKKYLGWHRDEIINESGDRSITGLGSQPGGPDTEFRYIEDPLNPNLIIDLRHMLVIGKYGRAIGESVEFIQYLDSDSRESAFDDQDYYSNELGYQFYAEFGSAIEHNPTAVADFLITFLNDKSLRNNISNPDRCK